jgi:N utilization substance protein A
VIIDVGAKSMDVFVPDDQLSLAIGRKGQNVRLAVQLTGWRIDIKSESKMREVASWLAKAVAVVEGWGEPEAEILLNQGITSLQDLSRVSAELLLQLPGIDEAGAEAVKARAAELADEQRELEVKAAAEAHAAELAEMAAAAAPPVAAPTEAVAEPEPDAVVASSPERAPQVEES